MCRQRKRILELLKSSAQHIKQLDQILTQTITTGLIHTTPTWNCILRAYSKSPIPIKAILIYNHSMKSGSIHPDNYTFPALLKACKSLNSLPKGKELHTHITKLGLDEDVFAQNALIHFYGSTAQIEDARFVFETMSQRDTASWNSLLAAYNTNSTLHIEETLVLFKEMMHEGIEADPITLVNVLSALAGVGGRECGRVVHSYVIKAGFDFNLNMVNALLSIYVKFGNMDAALTLFKEMSGRQDLVSCTILINGYVETGFIDLARNIFDQIVDKDTVLWNSMIHGYVEVKRPNEALELFQKMETEMVKPDETTIVSVLTACACLSDLQYGRVVHRSILRNSMKPDVFVGMALVGMYSKCGSMDEAMVAFYKTVDRDVFTWTAAIGGLANHGHVIQALKLFDQMESQGVKPNEATFVSALAACRQSGLVSKGCLLFDKMVRIYNIQPKIEHFGCLIDLLSRAGLVHQAEEFVRTMPPGERLVAYKTLLSASMSYSKIDLGLKVADELIRLGSDDNSVYILLSNFYALVGEWSKVAEIRTKMKKNYMLKEPGISSIEARTPRTEMANLLQGKVKNYFKVSI